MGFDGSENNFKEIFEIKFDEKNNIEDGTKCASAVDEFLSK